MLCTDMQCATTEIATLSMFNSKCVLKLPRFIKCSVTDFTIVETLLFERLISSWGRFSEIECHQMLCFFFIHVYMFRKLIKMAGSSMFFSRDTIMYSMLHCKLGNQSCFSHDMRFDYFLCCLCQMYCKLFFSQYTNLILITK